MGKEPRRRRGDLKEQVINLFHTYPSWTSIMLAEKLGVRSEYVRATLRRNNLSLFRGKKNASSWKLQPWEKQAVIDAYLGGEKLEAVAEEFGITPSAICRIAERNGLKRRRTTITPPRRRRE